MVTRILLALCLCLACVRLHAQENASSPSPEQVIAAQAAQIQANPQAVLGEDAAEQVAQMLERAKAYQEPAQAIADQGAALVADAPQAAESIASGTDALARTLMRQEQEQDGPPRPPVRYRIFVSQSMPDAEVKALAQATIDQPDAVLVVRGLKPGQKFEDLTRWLMNLMGPLKPDMEVPAITIDPGQFTALAVDQAPVLARYTPAGSAEGYVAGVTSLQWLDERLAAGQGGDLGTFGPTVPVLEEDMGQLFRKAAESIDFVAMRDRAIAKFWTDNVPRYDLPEVDVARTRLVDPSFVVQEDMTLPDGQVLFRRGDVINPLDAMPFDQVVVVLNPQREGQIEVAREVIRRNPGRRVTLMATDLSGVGTFEGYGELVAHVGARLYMMPEALRRQFRVENVPTVVTARDGRFVVEEVPPDMLKE